MITVCHPQNEMELALLVGIFESEEIPYFIFGQYFGGLMPGIQIAAYNDRKIMVPEAYVTKAIEIIEELRDTEAKKELVYAIPSSLRMIAEALLFGWFVVGGKKVPINKVSKNELSVSEDQKLTH